MPTYHRSKEFIYASLLTRVT